MIPLIVRVSCIGMCQMFLRGPTAEKGELAFHLSSHSGPARLPHTKKI
jgi:hypothetical protein